MKKILIVVGTRPDAIKMAPIVLQARNHAHLHPIVCATGQHRELLDQVTDFFGIAPDVDLDLMRPKQDLYDITTGCLMNLRTYFGENRPDMVLVQGDTTTSFSAALAAFYSRIPVAHVEAGLRTGNIWAPYPEEYNRRAISPLAALHFAPTSLAVENLLAENIPANQVHLTGNTSIDALLWGRDHLKPSSRLQYVLDGRPVILMTCHRRENFGEPVRRIFGAVQKFAQENPEFRIVYPVHPNPNVLEPAHQILGSTENISLIEPVSYSALIELMQACVFVLTDSGGLQEEAPSLGKPTLVLRETTERAEAVDAGCAALVGHDPEKILDGMRALSDKNSKRYRAMAHASNPFGDGTAATQIIQILEKFLIPQSELNKRVDGRSAVLQRSQKTCAASLGM